MEIQDRLAAAIGTHRGMSAADLLCAACVDLLGVDGAAISLVFDGVSTGTLGVSDASARRYDELQFTLGEGPCLDAVAQRGAVMVPDVTDAAEGRWPAYAPALSEHGIRGVYAMPVLLAGEYVGALDLYRSEPGSLSVDSVAGSLVAAELAELPLLDLLAEDLQAAAEHPDVDVWTELNRLTRVEVGQATGMLMAQLDVEPAEALARLRAHAYATGASATDVARAIIDRDLRLERDQ